MTARVAIKSSLKSALGVLPWFNTTSTRAALLNGLVPTSENSLNFSTASWGKVLSGTRISFIAVEIKPSETVTLTRRPG